MPVLFQKCVCFCFMFWQMYSNFKETDINSPEALSFNLEETKTL